jgi:hypothetical protein
LAVNYRLTLFGNDGGPPVDDSLFFIDLKNLAGNVCFCLSHLTYDLPYKDLWFITPNPRRLEVLSFQISAI